MTKSQDHYTREKEPMIPVRRTKDHYIFLCPRCGNVHKHGNATAGSRGPHCNEFPEQPGKFGTPFKGYKLIEDPASLGELTHYEGSTIFDLTKVAFDITKNIEKYLEMIDIDPTSKLRAKLMIAEKALKEVAIASPKKINPIEKLQTKKY